MLMRGETLAEKEKTATAEMAAARALHEKMQ
jgi:hypothetical protein